MSLFTSEQVERVILRGERELSIEVPFLCDRFSPSIVAGTQSYALPTDVHSIRRITWLGYKIWPLDHRVYRGLVIPSQQGTPYGYVFNNIGQLEIAFTYIPNVTIPAGIVNLWEDDIPTSVIIEYYKIADGATFVIPAYWRRRLLKLYLARQTYKVESPGQNKRLAQWYKARWEKGVKDFGEHVNDMINKPRKLVVQGNSNLSQQLNNGLHLPFNFGIGTEDIWP